jgi:Fe2+ transport system protein FeoA
MELALEFPRTVQCPLCGTNFDPAGNRACGSCPLNRGCQVVCCPSCGFETVDVEKSRLVTGLTNLISRLRALRARPFASKAEAISLAGLPAGTEASVSGFAQELPLERQAQLQAYGLVPGRPVKVIQQSPVTVVQIEHTELALENSLARQIQIKAAQVS